MIKINDIKKVFRTEEVETCALREVNLEVKEGDEEHPDSGLAVVMSNGEEGIKTMEIGKKHAGKTFTDALGYWQAPIVIDENGWADFPCYGKSVSIWTSGYSQ